MKLFTTNYASWKVFYKKDNHDWISLKGQNGYWYADPILKTFAGKLYLFTEAYNLFGSIGQIAVSVWNGNFFSVPKVIIKRPYHMSYPCVFEYNHNLYMIPETGQNKTLELYCADNNSVFNWKREKVLLEGEILADATVYYDGENYYIIAYVEEIKHWKTKVYLLNMAEKEITELETVESDVNDKRPAGKFFENEGKLFRPVQYNIDRYGGALIIEEVESVHPLKTSKYRTICVDEISIREITDKGLGTHTLSIDGDVYVVDVLVKGKNIFSPIINITRKVRNKYYKIIK